MRIIRGMAFLIQHGNSFDAIAVPFNNMFDFKRS
jgi:hypothetical protein